ncbi:hypothetical protein L21SP5_03834 [Salinivirga cyanobacteriivorans]|uniref:Uncharacterized protein n=1 Tax=Salinivirga cyanobacteriivorans TaxID=1307839 RepID=A0A0S2I4V5_9BACT|nr:hypothetical protein [Salinivirga cyanobacteriivorans]ALO17427.1 hypothetical protein L21SP5_03834 [Salinivirga cyanobacteriivorans]
MQTFVKISDLKTKDELKDAWSLADYRELMNRFEVPDPETVKDNEVRDFLFMAINEFEPEESAVIVLDYKLSGYLNEGQIDNLSNEMLREKMPEKYSEIDFHKTLFEVNQLLYKAYNGKFPHIQFNVLDLEIKASDNETEINKEFALKALSHGLNENNLLWRLFGDQLESKVAFPEADAIVWDLNEKGDDQYELIISEKWLTQGEIEKTEYECTVTPYNENEADD